MNRWKNILALAFILVFSQDRRCRAQFSKTDQFQIDSLTSVIKNPTTHDTSKTEAYVGLAEILYVSNPDTILPLCETAKTIIYKAFEADNNMPIKVKKSLSLTLAAALNNIGYLKGKKGDFNAQIECNKQSLAIRKEFGDKEGMANSLNNIGYVYYKQGNVPVGLEYFHKALKIRESIANKKGAAMGLNNIAYIYKQQGETDKSIEYFNRSLRLRKELNDHLGVSMSLNNIGYMYNAQANEIMSTKENLSRVDSIKSIAIDFHLRSIEIQEELEYESGISDNLFNIAVIYKEQASFLEAQSGRVELIRAKRHQALENFLKAYEIRQELGDVKSLVGTMSALGLIYLQVGENTEAQYHIK